MKGDPDYVVVGAGSSGCVIVHRLSADPSRKVLLLEAGASGEGDPAVTTPGRWVSLMKSAYDWGYETEPEPGLEYRRIAWPRGKAHGGSSTINAMAHIRGHRASFDRWRERGNPGWSYVDLLPLFRRSEGQLAVSPGLDAHAGHFAFLEAAAQHGFDADVHHDFNVPEPEGVAGFYEKNILNGRRHSAAAAFLMPAVARPNLEVRAHAHVTRVLIEGHRAVGVEFVLDGCVERVRAAREVILCAGAVDSPKLLMLSGIGNADHMRAHGISPIADVPGVGRNLQDHLKVSIRWKGKTILPGSTVTAGLFTSTPPDLQFYVGRGIDQPDGFITITVSHVRPASRGQIRLRSSDPFASPLLFANYLCERADVDALVAGARLARAIGSSPPYDRLRAEELDPGPAVTSASDLEQFVRRAADTIYHLAGTCRMGPASDRESVVDSELRVHGIDGLRVADASIMPEVVNAPTNAACLVVGEKCADLMAE